MFSKDKAENEFLGGSRVKSQKGGEKFIFCVEANFYKWLMACESRWRLLVFWVSHIHWKRLRDKVDQISEDSVVRNMHRHTHAQSVNNNRWLSTAKSGRRSTASQNRLRTSQSVDNSLNCRQVAVPVEGFQQEINRRLNSTQQVSVCRQLTGSCQ